MLVTNLFLHNSNFLYVIDGKYYEASSLRNIHTVVEDFRKLPYEFHNNCPYNYGLELSIKCPNFIADPNGSTIVALFFSEKEYMLYQRQLNGLCVELSDRIDLNNARLENFTTVFLPLPNGVEIDDKFQKLFSEHFDEEDTIIDEIFDTFHNKDLDNDFYNEILNLLNKR